MVYRGTASKRSAALGGAALVAGATLSALSLTTAPAAHAAAQNVPYTCTVGVTYLDVLGVPVRHSVEADMTANIAGGVSGQVHVGDPVTLSGFQTLANVAGPITSDPGYLLATSISGHYDSFPVTAQVGDVGRPQTVSSSMDISPTTPSSSGFTLSSPASPMSVSGFTADEVGTMTFTAGATVSGNLSVEMPTGTQQWPITCHTGDTSSIASTNVIAKPSSPPPSHPSSPTAPPSGTPPTHGASAPPSLGNADPSPTTSSSTTAPMGTSNTNRTTAQRPQLADTGFSQTEDLTIGGGVLVLLGAGLMYAARRRGVTDLDT